MRKGSKHTRHRMSQSRLGKKPSEASRKKMAEAQREAWAKRKLADLSQLPTSNPALAGLVPTGKIIQAQQLLGQDYIMPKRGAQVERPLYGELYTDSVGNPAAVVVHTKTVVEVEGLRIVLAADGPGGTKEVVYMKATPDPAATPEVNAGPGAPFSPDPRPSARPGQELDKPLIRPEPLSGRV